MLTTWRPSFLCYWLSTELCLSVTWNAKLVSYGLQRVVCSNHAKAQNQRCLDARVLTWQHIIASVIC